MQNLSFDWQIDEYMINCRSRQLRPRTMNSYEQSLRLFERWCKEQLGIIIMHALSGRVYVLLLVLGAGLCYAESVARERSVRHDFT